MNCVLPAFDSIQTMFEQIRVGTTPDTADEALIEALKCFADPNQQAAPPQSVAVEKVVIAEVSSGESE